MFHMGAYNLTGKTELDTISVKTKQPISHLLISLSNGSKYMRNAKRENIRNS